MKFPRKPGPGWSKLAPMVWEHTSGVRIHTSGLVRLPNREHVFAQNDPHWRDAELAKRQQGGNRRGLMVWALAPVNGGPETKLQWKEGK